MRRMQRLMCSDNVGSARWSMGRATQTLALQLEHRMGDATVGVVTEN